VAGSGREPADEALAVALAAGRTVADAATAAGVSESTAYRRLRDPEFRARVTELRDEMVSRAAGRLADSMTEAADVLRALLADADPHLRHKAAVKLIELGVKVTELADLERRVEDLEQRFADPNQNSGGKQWG
jgi:AcrR family transcriptional regulator